MAPAAPSPDKSASYRGCCSAIEGGSNSVGARLCRANQRASLAGWVVELTVTEDSQRGQVGLLFQLLVAAPGAGAGFWRGGGREVVIGKTTVRGGNKQRQRNIHGAAGAAIFQRFTIEEVGAHQWCLLLYLGQWLCGRQCGQFA